MDNLILTLPRELLGEIIHCLMPEGICAIASTSRVMDAMVWALVTDINFPDDGFKNSQLILPKLSPATVSLLSIDFGQNDLTQFFDLFVEALTSFSRLTCLKFSTGDQTDGIYDTIITLSQLRSLEIMENDAVKCPLSEQLTRLSNITDLSLSSESNQFPALAIEKFTNLKSLRLPFCSSIQDDLIERIMTLTRLEFLDLTWASKITDHSFVDITRMTNLTKLDLSRCLGIQSDSFKRLNKLPKLWTLDLSYHHALTSHDVEIISQLPHLTCLFLVSNSALGKEATSYIARMTKLEEFHFETAPQSCRSLSVLTALTNLRTLFAHYYDDSHCIAMLPRLEHLSINSLGDEDVTWLRSLTTLHDLHFSPRFGHATVLEELRAALPNTAFILPQRRTGNYLR